MTATTLSNDLTFNWMPWSGLVAAIITGTGAATAAAETPEPVSIYRQTNVSAEIRYGAALASDKIMDAYRPRTALGARLWALRCAYIKGGGALLDEKALETEIRLRRGGVVDA